MKLHLKQYLWIIIPAMIVALLGCDQKSNETALDIDARGHVAPTQATRKVNSEFGQELLWDSQEDFEQARRGFIASSKDLRVRHADGRIIWDQPAYDFIKGDAPPSVNPSLWRQEKLNNINGLFKVSEGIFQLRGHDLANITLIRGQSGWIIVDPLTAEETAAAALELARNHLGNDPISAIIFTHSHIDHFGGVLGIINEKEVKERGIRVIAPKGFMEEATSENIIAGIAMGRRSLFMYGKNLARSERGHVGSGLGKGPAYGTFSILEPNEIVNRSGQEKTIDGVRFIFQFAPGTEAPAELTFYLPDFKAFCGAEIVSRHMHNLYTLRGTKIRDALKWSSAIGEAITLFGDAEIYFGSHHWPIWGNKKIKNFLTKQRDLYKYIHDQTVRMFNNGYTSSEIAEQLELPKSLSTPFFNRGYYGSLRHNIKAVYQAYLGWYDGNPANLNPLPPTESGHRYIEMMGGAESVIEKAQEYYDQGEHRWVAQLLNHLVFAEPDNEKAKAMLAKTYDQLGYQSESGPWRDVYLSAAHELRHGPPEKGLDIAVIKGVLEKTPVSYFFDSMAVRLNGPKAEGKKLTVRIRFTDLNESYDLHLENSVLHHQKASEKSDPSVILKVTHDLFVRMLVGQLGVQEMVFSDDLSVEGSKLDLVSFLRLMDKPSANFNIVTP
jgi:linear primary-alkylsulfatase